MDNVAIRQLGNRPALTSGLVSRQLARLDWTRLRGLAEEVRHFIHKVRRKIRFGERQPNPSGPIAPNAFRPSREAETDPGFTIRPR